MLARDERKKRIEVSQGILITPRFIQRPPARDMSPNGVCVKFEGACRIRRGAVYVAVQQVRVAALAVGFIVCRRCLNRGIEFSDGFGEILSPEGEASRGDCVARLPRLLTDRLKQGEHSSPERSAHP